MSGSTVNTFAHYLYSGGSRAKKLIIKDNGDYESVTYIDGVFEYHKKVNTSATEEKNYLLLQGNVEVRIGGYTGEDNETTLYTVSDYLSSAAIRLKDDGALYDKEEYYPYGDSSLKTYGKKRYRFTGKEKDEESGLYYYSARYYASWCMKFLSVDPLAGKYAHQSSYCYADCNPVVKNDPSGMQAEGGYQWSNGGNDSKVSGAQTPLAEGDKGRNTNVSEGTNKSAAEQRNDNVTAKPAENPQPYTVGVTETPNVGVTNTAHVGDKNFNPAPKQTSAEPQPQRVMSALPEPPGYKQREVVSEKQQAYNFARGYQAYMDKQHANDPAWQQVNSSREIMRGVANVYSLVEGGVGLYSLGKNAAAAYQFTKTWGVQNTAYYAYNMAGARLLSVSTPAGRALFWSGTTNGESVGIFAKEYAQINNLVKLEMTPAGIFLENSRTLKILGAEGASTRVLSGKVWDMASYRFAFAAKGEVYAVMGASVRAQSVWNRIEKSTLLKNEPNRTINIIQH